MFVTIDNKNIEIKSTDTITMTGTEYIAEVLNVHAESDRFKEAYEDEREKNKQIPLLQNVLAKSQHTLAQAKALNSTLLKSISLNKLNKSTYTACVGNNKRLDTTLAVSLDLTSQYKAEVEALKEELRNAQTLIGALQHVKELYA